MDGGQGQTESAAGAASPPAPDTAQCIQALAGYWGCPPADVAVSVGLVSDEMRSRAYAQGIGRRYWTEAEIAARLTRPAAVAAARHRIVLVPKATGGAAAIVPAPTHRPRTALRYTNVAVTAPSAFFSALARFWPDIVRDVTNRLSAERPRFSAAYRRIGPQLVWFAIFVLVAMLGTLPWTVWPALVGNVVLCGAFLALAVLRLLALPRPTYPRPAPLRMAELPVYTVLVPLYREAAVVADLITHLRALDYPLPKLDIRLLIEADDAETIEALSAITLPPHMEVVTIPVVAPRTKPKALNVGMIGARGTLVTIYDAEDVPDRDQLRKAASRFAAAGPDVACLQARLRIDNAGEGVLPALFAIEYEALFRRFLPALERFGLPLPLGGTSNHMRREALEAIGGWDAYNVTEDADLGLRMVRFGYRVETLDSDTWEEAPTSLGTWFGQRARWYKGWLQTWIVHMRDPGAYLRQAGLRGFVGLQLLMGGMFLAAVAHPMLLAATGFWAFGLAGAPTGNGFLAGLNMTTILLGHGAMMTLTWVAAANGPHAGRRLWLVPLLPLYTLLHTLAAFRAVWDYLASPFHWAKTEHGKGRRERHAA